MNYLNLLKDLHQAGHTVTLSLSYSDKAWCANAITKPMCLTDKPTEFFTAHGETPETAICQLYLLVYPIKKGIPNADPQ